MANTETPGFDDWVNLIVHEIEKRMTPADWVKLNERPALWGIDVGVREDLREDTAKFGYERDQARRTKREAERLGGIWAAIYTRRLGVHKAILAGDMKAMDRIWNEMSPEEKPWVVRVLGYIMEYFSGAAPSN